MQKLKKWIKGINKKQKILLLIILLIVGTFAITLTTQTALRIYRENLSSGILEWEIVEQNGFAAKILITVKSSEGIEEIELPDKDILYCNNKTKVAIDYDIKEQISYNFKIKQVGKSSVTETVYWELPKSGGEYTLKDGLYASKPDLTGYQSDYTRYLAYENGNIIPGNWISGEEPANWYNYNESQWANIYVEKDGKELYYVWIPKYCYKLDQETQRSDVKFIDANNNCIDENGSTLYWKDLAEQGYEIPESFCFDGKNISGYWIMKYLIGETSENVALNFNTDTINEIAINNITLNSTVIDTSLIKKYTIAVNGQIIKTIENEDEVNNVADQIIAIETEDGQESLILNVTALDANGEIVTSMTKKQELEVIEPVVVNEPVINSFKKETTFYVTYDKNGNEESTIPITEESPENWYNYTYRKWANIVTRNNNLETYFTWIPKYCYKLDQENERSDIKFIDANNNYHDKDGNITYWKDLESQGYLIPEAFTFNRTRINRILGIKNISIWNWC